MYFKVDKNQQMFKHNYPKFNVFTATILQRHLAVIIFFIPPLCRYYHFFKPLCSFANKCRGVTLRHA